MGYLLCWTIDNKSEIVELQVPMAIVFIVFFASGTAFPKQIVTGTMLKRYSSKNVFSAQLWSLPSGHSIPHWKFTMHTSIFKFLRILPVKKFLEIQASICQTYFSIEVIFPSFRKCFWLTEIHCQSSPQIAIRWRELPFPQFITPSLGLHAFKDWSRQKQKALIACHNVGQPERNIAVSELTLGLAEAFVETISQPNFSFCPLLFSSLKKNPSLLCSSFAHLLILRVLPNELPEYLSLCES